MAHIFIADDDSFVLYTLRKILLRAGHTVACFENGLQALDQLQKETPDLVITDVVMPGMSGLDMLAQLRTFNSKTPVLLVSAGSLGFEVDLKDVAAKSGANGVLYKPFDRAAFLACVATLLP
ncbi:MAG: response regulator [Rhodoferax sp.]|nr:response regulator [Rhodoferax sp.]